MPFNLCKKQDEFFPVAVEWDVILVVIVFSPEKRFLSPGRQVGKFELHLQRIVYLGITVSVVRLLRRFFNCRKGTNRSGNVNSFPNGILRYFTFTTFVLLISPPFSHVKL